MISVIIPTYQEEDTIGRTVRNLISHAYHEQYEVLVIDASKDKRTVNKVRKIDHPAVSIFSTDKGRARQMNHGASRAKGDIFLFLHADTKLCMHWDSFVGKAIEEGYNGGCFLKQFEPSSFALSLLSRYNNFMTLVRKDFLGDNTIYVTKKAFFALGGFPSVPIMEDYVFAKKLRKQGRISVIKRYVTTSSRRFSQRGIWRSIGLDIKIRFLYTLGVSPEKLKLFYGDGQ